MVKNTVMSLPLQSLRSSVGGETTTVNVICAMTGKVQSLREASSTGTRREGGECVEDTCERDSLPSIIWGARDIKETNQLQTCGSRFQPWLHTRNS